MCICISLESKQWCALSLFYASTHALKKSGKSDHISKLEMYAMWNITILSTPTSDCWWLNVFKIAQQHYKKNGPSDKLKYTCVCSTCGLLTMAGRAKQHRPKSTKMGQFWRLTTLMLISPAATQTEFASFTSWMIFTSRVLWCCCCRFLLYVRIFFFLILPLHHLPRLSFLLLSYF